MTPKPSTPAAGPAEPAAPAAQPAGAAAAPASRPAGAAEAVSGLLGAGFQALKGVHDDIRARRSRVFAALLGAEADTAAAGSAQTEGVNDAWPRRFDSVFDQRVAESLQRLGYPPPEVFAALVDLLGSLPKVQGAGESAVAPKVPAASRRPSAKSRSARTAKKALDPKN